MCEPKACSCSARLWFGIITSGLWVLVSVQSVALWSPLVSPYDGGVQDSCPQKHLHIAEGLESVFLGTFSVCVSTSEA